MNTVPAAPKLGFKFTLTVKEGPDKGASFQLLPPRVTIGRGPDNNVPLNDPRVSRSAAVIEFSMEQIIITDVSTRQTMVLNDAQTEEASIKDGDVVKIGSTELCFNVEALPLAPQPPAHPPKISQLSAQQLSTSTPFERPTSHYASAPTRPPSSANSGRLRFYIILALVGAGLYWLLGSDSAQKKQESGLKTLEQIENDIKESETRQQEIIEKRTFKSAEEKTRYEEAQVHYLQGFRDYQKNQFGRAIRSFETALAIDPGHSLAGRYKRLAEKRRDEMIAMLTLEGRRYKEKSMYTRCSAAFEKVLDAIPNKDDVKYKQAEALKKECDLLTENRFQ